MHGVSNGVNSRNVTSCVLTRLYRAAIEWRLPDPWRIFNYEKAFSVAIINRRDVADESRVNRRLACVVQRVDRASIKRDTSAQRL